MHICRRLEAVSDVISGVNVEQVSMDIHVKRGDSRSNRSRYIRLPHFVTDERRRLTDPVVIGVLPKKIGVIRSLDKIICSHFGNSCEGFIDQ